MSRRARILTIGGALLLLILSRLPFLLADPSWGVFAMEHIWLLDEPAAVEHMEELTGASGTRLTEFNDNLFGQAYHAGAAWIAECVRAMGRLTGSIGLRELKLVGVSASVLALGVYLWALLTIWPTRPVRWVLPVVLAWLAPPTLLLWSTVMPMGHYLDSWFFHALFLPFLISALDDKAGPRTMIATGALGGIAVAYVLSNIMFPLLIGGLFLLLSQRRLAHRLGLLGGLGLGFVGTYVPLAAARWANLAARLGEVQTDNAAGGSLWGRILDNIVVLSSKYSLEHGGSWAHRGLLTILEPGARYGWPTTAVLVGLASIAVLYLGWLGVRLLRPASAQQMDLTARLLGAHGLLLVGGLVACLVLLDATPVVYLTLIYPPLVFGMAQVVAEWWDRAPRRLGLHALPAIVLLGLLAVGWQQSAAFNLRPLDLPGIVRSDFMDTSWLQRVSGASDAPRASSDPLRFKENCLAVHPQDEAFCSVSAWSHERSPGEVRLCTDLPLSQGLNCATGAGLHHHSMQVCHQQGGDPWLEPVDSICTEFEGPLRHACISGAYQAAFAALYLPAQCTMEATRRCPDEPTSTSRRCNEILAWTLTGMPPLPVHEGPVPPACAHWPVRLHGLCVQATRPAGEGSESCEEVYLSRFAKTIPERNALMYQQCALLGAVIDWRMFPTCAIGVARALEGLDCTWTGSPLRVD